MTTFSESLQALASRQKPTRGAPAYSRWVNRPLGRTIAATAYVLGRTPDQVTAAGAVCTVLAIGLVATVPPSALSAALITVLLVVGYALDAADGQLARLSGRTSRAGDWLDHVLDAAKIPALHLAVAVHWYRSDPGAGRWLLVPVVFALVSSVLFAAHLLDGRVGRPPSTSRSPSAGRVVSVVTLPTDYGLVCLSFALWWWQPGFRVLHAVLCASTLAFAMVALPTWYHQLRRSP